MGIEVLPPDVNESDMDFAPAPGERRAIRYGLSAVRNVGEGAVRQDHRGARAPEGAFPSFADFCRSIDPGCSRSACSSRSCYAGAFESLGYTRGGLLQCGEQPAFERCRARSPPSARPRPPGSSRSSAGAATASGRGEIDEDVLQAPEFDKRLLLRQGEGDARAVRDRPPAARGARGARGEVLPRGADLEDLGDGDLVTVGGIIGAFARKYTKRGEPYAQFRLEGLAGGVDVVAFPSVFEAVPELIEPDRIVLATGRIDQRGRELQIRATEVREPDLGTATSSVAADALVVDLPAAACTPVGARQAAGAVRGAYPGGAPVRVRFLSSEGVTPLQVGAFTCTPGRRSWGSCARCSAATPRASSAIRSMTASWSSPGRRFRVSWG